jgi:hypothetical protein
MSYTNLNNPANYQLQSFGQDGMRTISTTQAYVEGEYYRVLVATEDSTLSATSMVGDDLASIDVYAGTTIYGLFTAVTVTAGEVTAYLAGRTNIDDVWAYIRAYGVAGGATIEGEDCAKAAISPLLDKYYAQASLVMVPSLYKTSIVYSERPLSTDGELTFTRASNASRIGPDGLIEKVRTNLALYSEAQDSWTDQFQTSVTANAAANPLNGAVTADKVIPSATTDDHYRGLSMGSIIGEFTSSIYVKADGYSIIDYGVYNNSTSSYPVRAVFDLSTQTITHINGSISSITSVGSGWYRISVTASVASTSTMGIYHRVRSTGTSGAYAGDGTSGMLLWGCQLESGVTTDYVGPTTTAAVSVGPVANLPRLDYLGSTCPRLLLEPQRTNLALYSEQFNNAAWTKTNTTITANATTSPDGYANADKLVEDTSTGTHQIQKILTVSAATVYTTSVFVKYAGREWIRFTDAQSSNRIHFNTLTGVFGTTSGTVIDYNSTTLGDGWYKLSLTTTSVGTAYTPRITLAEADNDITYTGDGTSGVYIYGAQLEAGAYATSYIPTLGAAVTRGLDACSKTGISSLIGQTEGTLFVEADLSNVVDPLNIRGILEVNDGTTSNRFSIYRGANDLSLNVIVFTAAAAVANIAASTITGPTKIAVAYNSSDVTVYINGSLIGTDTSVTIPACSDLDLGIITTNTTRILGDGINQALLFKTRLTNAQLAELTTL